MSFRLFAVTAPGLEPYTAAELVAMGIETSAPISSNAFRRVERRIWWSGIRSQPG